MPTHDPSHPGPLNPPNGLIAAVRAARRIVVLTGAGMSAESGIPTFRDALTGLWSTFDPRELATRVGFKRDPALVWGWYESRRRAVLRTTPNAGHVALRDLTALPWVDDLTIVTQNVDDLHERAGSAGVIHLHGSLFAPRCLTCGRPYVGTGDTDTDNLMAPIADQPVPPPSCTHCQGLIRPGVVWFSEELPAREWRQALDRLGAADLLLVVGTSGQVYPVASLPNMARQAGCAVWVINPDHSPLAEDGKLWKATAATALPGLVNELTKSAN